MLAPIITLVAWTLVMWIWMYATRIPAIQAARIPPQDAAHPGSLNVLPSEIRRVADNYNHLHEQPTIFYALALALYVGQMADALSVQLAWAYVGLRVLHSLTQATVNRVAIRFGLFALSSVVLIIMCVRGLIAVLQG